MDKKYRVRCKRLDWARDRAILAIMYARRLIEERRDGSDTGLQTYPRAMGFMLSRERGCRAGLPSSRINQDGKKRAFHKKEAHVMHLCSCYLDTQPIPSVLLHSCFLLHLHLPSRDSSYFYALCLPRLSTPDPLRIRRGWSSAMSNGYVNWDSAILRFESKHSENCLLVGT